MVGDIFYKNADITVAPLGVTFERGSYVDFLPTVKHYYMDLYISKDSQEHAIDFHLLLSPFAQDSWIVIIFASLVIALVKLGILKLHGNICQLSSYILIRYWKFLLSVSFICRYHSFGIFLGFFVDIFYCIFWRKALNN